MKLNVRSACYLGILVSFAVHAASPPLVNVPNSEEIISRLRPGHPRLLVSNADFERLKQSITADPLLRQWTEKLRNESRGMLNQSPSKYEIPDGLRLLDTSRRVLHRVYVLALMYRLEGEKRFAERAWQELEAAANFQDWNPRHFLDTAEMTHAFAIGYDWLYDFWTPAQRDTLRTAMIEKGIKLAQAIEDEHRWWAVANHNWNQVCNGGIGMGALALADVEPKVAGDFLHAALISIQLPMAEYGPDGAWAEGPGYWHYATSYNVTFLAGLQSALGTDFGLARITGFSDAGTFPIYASGPTRLSFSYADSHAGVVRAPEMFWLAREFNRPEFAWNQRNVATGDPLDLIWYDARLARAPSTPPPLDKYYRHSEVVTMRSAWDNTNALFVGFKAGDNKVNHSHLDLGSFVLDALGIRWADDIGSDNYNMPDYFGNKRWTYYRLRAEGHNTIGINPGAGPDQEPKAVTKITRFESSADRAFAIADLTPAYSGQATRVARGIQLLGRKRVLIQDEIHAVTPASFWWFLHTPAEVSITDNGRSAVFSRGKSRMIAHILWPNTARLMVMDAQPLPSSPNPSMQNKNSGIRKLAIHLEDIGDLNLGVLLTPLREGEEESTERPALAPLANW